MYLGVSTLVFLVIVLSAAGFIGMMKFRKLTKNIRERSQELPKAAKLAREVIELRSLLWRMSQPENEYDFQKVDRLDIQAKVKLVEMALENYQVQLENCEVIDPRIGDKTAELEFVTEFERRLDSFRNSLHDTDTTRYWFQTNETFIDLEQDVVELQKMATEIPVYMQQRMTSFAERARTEYHAWMTFSVVIGATSILLIGFLIYCFRSRIIHPLEKLVEGSRQVAGGNFDYRIKLETDDEVKELADALNAMTSNFQAIKTDLNRQVQQRTKEVVRSEKMASVGFLAAGVAHEINNPLATIAWSAESLESRIHDIVSSDSNRDEIEDMKKYLRRIQDEAFRCKGITSGLLDFSRMGDVKKVPTDLIGIIHSVIEMVKPLSKYRNRNIHFDYDAGMVAVVNEQEMKQVALNLITNALGSIEEGGTVSINLKKSDNEQVNFIVKDDGCGMTDEVLQHLFEPFFTRRRDGQGTGLGLSITYQIVEEHGGRIQASSGGPGKGSSFKVSLPLTVADKLDNVKVA